ncbi:MAG: hypothetical protein KBT06_04160 [Prevotellaceae bacterium]|nr:hypothetical protein [Candidatus Colivivens equi]
MSDVCYCYFDAFGFVPVPRVSLRLPWAMNRLAFQAASGEGSAQQPAKEKSQPTTNREQLQACLALPRCEGGRQKSKSPKM